VVLPLLAYSNRSIVTDHQASFKTPEIASVQRHSHYFLCRLFCGDPVVISCQRDTLSDFVSVFIIVNLWKCYYIYYLPSGFNSCAYEGCTVLGDESKETSSLLASKELDCRSPHYPHTLRLQASNLSQWVPGDYEFLFCISDMLCITMHLGATNLNTRCCRMHRELRHGIISEYTKGTRGRRSQ
jgi:hypothetical protein